VTSWGSSSSLQLLQLELRACFVCCMFHTADDVIWRLARLFVHSWIELVKRESLINLTAQALRDCEWWRFDISRRVIDREHRCFSQLHPPIGPMQGPAHLDRSEGHGKSLLNWRRPCNSSVIGFGVDRIRRRFPASCYTEQQQQSIKPVPSALPRAVTIPCYPGISLYAGDRE
jgi:hypothetical protein